MYKKYVGRGFPDRATFLHVTKNHALLVDWEKSDKNVIEQIVNEIKSYGNYKGYRFVVELILHNEKSKTVLLTNYPSIIEEFTITAKEFDDYHTGNLLLYTGK